MKRAVWFAACLLWANLASAETELKIMTRKGFVAFTAGSNWPVLQMQTTMPVAAAVFQLPNPAAEGGPDSTNLVMQLFEQGSEKEKTMFAAPVRQFGPVPPSAESFMGWKIYRQEALQGDTLYSIWDAKKEQIADTSAHVRLAWPHLANNPANYDQQMETAFRAFLSAVWGGLGEYKVKKGELVHRPSGARQSDPAEGARPAMSSGH